MRKEAAENSRKVAMSPRACSVRRAQREEADRLSLRLANVHQLPRQPAQTPLGPIPRSEVSRPPRSGRGQLALQFNR